MKIALYLRVSTDIQKERGYSLPTQLEACQKAANELGAHTIDEYIDDGYSGEYLDRPDMTRLRAAIKNKEYDAVIIYDPDRLARNLAHQLIITEEIEKSGAILKFVSVEFQQSAEGKLFYSIRGAVSEFEKAKILERTMRGKRGRASNGKLVIRINAFGHILNKEKDNYDVNEEEKQYVVLMCETIVHQKAGTATVAKLLNDMGLPSPGKSSAWTPSTVHRIVTDPRIKGIFYSMRYKHTKTGLKSRTRELRPESEWIPITVPPLISEELFDAVQRQLQANKAMAKRNLRYEHLLNGLVICAKCGRKMGIGHSGHKKRLAYYICHSQKSLHSIFSGVPHCGSRRIPTDILDDIVFKQLLELRKKPKAIINMIENSNSDMQTNKIKSTLTRLDKSEKELIKQKSTIMKWWRSQKISDEEADSQLDDIRKQLVDTQHHKKRLQNELQALNPIDPQDVLKRVQELFTGDNMTFDERRAAILQVIDNVICERIDNTWAKQSIPEIEVKIKFR